MKAMERDLPNLENPILIEVREDLKQRLERMRRAELDRIDSEDRERAFQTKEVE